MELLVGMVVDAPGLWWDIQKVFWMAEMTVDVMVVLTVLLVDSRMVLLI